MRTIKKVIYRFNELDKDGQDRAIRDYAESFDFDPDYIYEDFLAICDKLGVSVHEKWDQTYSGLRVKRQAIYWSGFGSQGDGACFEGDYAYKPEAVKEITEYAPQDTTLAAIAAQLEEVQARNAYRLAATITHRDRYVHAYSVDIDVQDAEDEDRTVGEEDEKLVTEALRDLMKWLYRQLWEEYFYQTSEEVVAEYLADCDFYEYYEDGSLYTD